MSKLSWLKDLRGVPMPYARYRVLLEVFNSTGKDGSNAYPGKDKLTARTGIDQRSLRRHLRALEADRWLVITTQGGNQVRQGWANVYRLGCGPNPRSSHTCMSSGRCYSNPSPTPDISDKGGNECTKGGNEVQARGVTSAPPSDPYIRSSHHSDENPSASLASEESNQDQGPGSNSQDPWAQVFRTTAKSAATKELNYDRMRTDIDYFEDYLESEGLLPDQVSANALEGMWQSGSYHPKAIINTLRARAGL